MTSSKVRGIHYTRICLLSVALAFATVTNGALAAAAEVSIDLLNLRLNQRPLANLTIDDITDILGRPSVSERSPEVVGAMIHYQRLGLTFWFAPPYMHPGRRLLMITIYLSETYDPHSRRTFQPFPGKLLPLANANWKTRDTLKMLGAYSSQQESPEQYERDVRDALRKGGGVVEEPVTPYHVVTVELKPTGRVVFFHEAATTFLEHVVVWPGD